MASTSDSDAGDATEGTSTDASSGDTDAGIDNVTTSIDLALLTYESCTEAGLVE